MLALREAIKPSGRFPSIPQLFSCLIDWLEEQGGVWLSEDDSKPHHDIRHKDAQLACYEWCLRLSTNIIFDFELINEGNL